MQNNKATVEKNRLTGLPKWQSGFLIQEFIMTLKKSKRIQEIKGQSIFEYFILTTVVVAVVLFFSSSQFFKDIKGSCTSAFNSAVTEMLK